ncbi:MAG: DUF2975 domain-containing protein [Novosphingobium sp.]
MGERRTNKDGFLAIAQTALSGFAALAFAMIFVSGLMALLALLGQFPVAGVVEVLGKPTDWHGLSVPLAAYFIATSLMFAVLWRFLKNLIQIVATVSAGDPFQSANAARLQRMAWLMLALQLIAPPVKAAAQYLAMTQNWRSPWSFNAMGMLFVVVLLVIARVFQQGAMMRDDLEGTV